MRVRVRARLHRAHVVVPAERPRRHLLRLGVCAQQLVQPAAVPARVRVRVRVRARARVRVRVRLRVSGRLPYLVMSCESVRVSLMSATGKQG